uniref:Disease resistance N-terminal domain-containing protein n=1 Tax=Oryza meridionalis TaxID=40149 RepID=A0A0E0DIK0_9ORYZ
MEIWSTVGSTAIGWLVQNILGSLIGDKLKSWLRQMSLDDDTKKLESEMKNISATLEVAKGHKINNEQPALARCLRDLKDLLYDAEDVMDELDYYRLQDETIRGAFIPFKEKKILIFFFFQP